MQKSLIIIIIGLSLLFSCNKQTKKNLAFNSNSGVTPADLNLISNGPKNYSLNYFPEDIILNNNIRKCQISETDSNSSRVSRLIIFDKRGNIIKDENYFFWDWEKGTARGSYIYSHKEPNLILQFKGVHTEDSKDSIPNNFFLIIL